MKIQFSVEGLPPKKDGAQSLWGKELESERVALLRRSAYEAFAGRPPLSKNISLSLKAHIGLENSRWIGDLDNHLTGICDGLQKRHPGSKLASVWNRSDNVDIHPDKVIGIVNDAEVVEIHAYKIISDRQWYEVALEGD